MSDLSKKTKQHSNRKTPSFDVFAFLLYFKCALRIPAEERLPSGEFGRILLQKNIPWGPVLNFSQRRRQVLMEALERVMPRVY